MSRISNGVSTFLRKAGALRGNLTQDRHCQHKESEFVREPHGKIFKDTLDASQPYWKQSRERPRLGLSVSVISTTWRTAKRRTITRQKHCNKKSAEVAAFQTAPQLGRSKATVSNTVVLWSATVAQTVVAQGQRFPRPFYKRRSQEKKHPLRLEIFLLRSPRDRTRSVLPYRAMCSVAGQCNPVVWVFSTSGFHLFFATKPVSSATSKAERGQIWRP
jgi:hypothetical protein